MTIDHTDKSSTASHTTLRIDSLAHGGAGVCRDENGRAVFVPSTAPGDTVRAEIVSEKAKYAQARLVEVLDAGPSRVAPACPLAPLCGGCHWQHIAYDTQVEQKRLSVLSALTRIGKTDLERAERLVESCAYGKRELGYRNKLELACGRDARGLLTLGFHAPGSSDVVPVPSCPLGHRALEKAPHALQGALRYLEGTSDLGLFRIGVRHSMRTKSCEVALWTSPGPFPRSAAAKTISSALPTTSIVRVVADPGSARKVKNVEVLLGAGNWAEELGGFDYLVSAPSFFQVNTSQAETLQRLVLEGLDVRSGMRVADLYSGVGTFTLPLAERCDDVVAVESLGPAVRDLRRNAESAGLWVDVVGGDSARELPDLGPLDALVVDPPRVGLAEGVAESIASAGPKRLAYVSCDPATWARDVARLAANGYQLTKATPVDLVPQTYPVEVVSIFEQA
ncbi:MAG: 23S rRNA (uracil(1939)-C(5))-methyltransferase RlmD [Eggerthellaceae bacterium]|nr:23S rRNA (uracil(1939)-C(5))-methyltransferase RlmD [Eggerthellaceae bacterium]